MDKIARLAGRLTKANDSERTNPPEDRGHGLARGLGNSLANGLSRGLAKGLGKGLRNGDAPAESAISQRREKEEEEEEVEVGKDPARNGDPKSHRIPRPDL